MNSVEAIGDKIAPGRKFTIQTKDFRERYETLVNGLRAVGSEVIVNRTLEKDPNIQPESFVLEAFHCFIFPKQPVQPEMWLNVVPDTNPYTLITEKLRTQFDRGLITGCVVVEYSDSYSEKNPPQIQVYDGLSRDSELPSEAEQLIEENLA